MAKRDDMKKKVKEEEEQTYGETSGYSEPDEDTDETYKEFVGHKPKKGNNIADEVKESEDRRRGKLPFKKDKIT